MLTHNGQNFVRTAYSGLHRVQEACWWCDAVNILFIVMSSKKLSEHKLRGGPFCSALMKQPSRASLHGRDIEH